MNRRLLHIFFRQGQTGRGDTAVRRTHMRALHLQLAQHGQAGLTETQHQHGFVFESVHLSLRVANPINTSSIVMIQKLTTTWVSFQPFSS